MNLYLDTEFNGFGGELISLALVSSSGHEFYQSLGCKSPCVWVAQHVMPVIGIPSVDKKQMQMMLHFFLMQFESVHIIADWPEDIKYFCELLITGPGERINTPPLTLEIRRDLNSDDSDVQHNALADVKSMMKNER